MNESAVLVVIHGLNPSRTAYSRAGQNDKNSMTVCTTTMALMRFKKEAKRGFQRLFVSIISTVLFLQFRHTKRFLLNAKCVFVSISNQSD